MFAWNRELDERDLKPRDIAGLVERRLTSVVSDALAERWTTHKQVCEHVKSSGLGGATSIAESVGPVYYRASQPDDDTQFEGVAGLKEGEANDTNQQK